ncbi:hypothetical protein [Flavobacterium frigoris]|uniref:hypothetical protein n=1 Tax=Flavobacterium frigoris TaxID=229204 RepID=UPI000944F8A0|nr:hypothetical protein [Flavobacterium frigoris]
MKNVYTYNRLLQKSGAIDRGTDFSFAELNAMLSFYLAVAWKDSKEYPRVGFQMKKVLTR